MQNRFRCKVTPKEVGIDVPCGVDQEQFEAGYQHGLISNRLEAHQLKLSFRLGFRKAKMEIRELQKVNNFPQKFKIINE